MNILYYASLKTNDLTASHVHVHEVVSNLVKLGHNVVPLRQDGAGTPSAVQPAKHLSPRARMNLSISSLSIYQRLKGEIYILWLLKGEIHTCLRALTLMIRRRQKLHLIYRRHTLFASECLLARLLRVPVVREVNGIIADEAEIAYGFDRFSLRVIAWIERRSMRRADRLIVVTPEMKELFKREYGIPGQKIAVIENGANTDLFAPGDSLEARTELRLDQHGYYICFVGSLARWQGVEYLLRSMPLILEECPGARTLIVGDGPMKAELVQLAEDLGVSDKAVFTGTVAHARVPLHIAACDICVAPFVRERNERSGLSPLKMCEYAACAKPVVASRLPGLEFLEQHRLGVLAQPEDPQALAAAIITLLKDPELRKKMGQNGREYVVEHRSWASVAKRVAEVCQQALEERKAGRTRTAKL